VASRSERQAYAHRRPGRQTARRFFIICEGPTEVAYFTQLGRTLGKGVIVQSTCGKSSAATSVVASAAKRKTGAPSQGIDKASEQDEVWAVFDWDDRTDQVAKALQEAKRVGVNVALSNPSFEVWVLWHFHDFMTTGCTQTQVESELAKYWRGYEKGHSLDFSRLTVERREDAISRAARAVIEHARAGRRYPGARPSSGIGELVEHIVGASQQVQASQEGNKK